MCLFGVDLRPTSKDHLGRKPPGGRSDGGSGQRLPGATVPGSGEKAAKAGLPPLVSGKPESEILRHRYRQCESDDASTSNSVPMPISWPTGGSLSSDIRDAMVATGEKYRSVVPRKYTGREKATYFF